jgi:hypothetical protein
MKRKALLAITGCTPKAFETYSARDQLPFSISRSNWSDYTIEDAFALKLFMQAAECTSLDNAARLARGALARLHPINPFSFYGSERLWVALATYAWPESPPDWECSLLVAGRWSDIVTQTEDALDRIATGVSLLGLLTFPASNVADEVLQEARDFGLPEGEVQPVPEDLTGFPDWFKTEETKRRSLVFGIGDRS